MDRLAVMQQFVRVVEAGSFSGAARILGQSQPAISKAMALLEERLGVRLLVRTTRAVTLTDAGQAFYDSACTAIDAADEAEAAARGTDAALSGRLRVSAPISFTRLHIVPKLATFLTAHPGIALELVLEDRNTPLLEEGIDLALRAGALEESSLVATRIAQAPRMLVATPGYFAQYDMPHHPDDLAQHRAILYGTAANWVFTKGASTQAVVLTPRLRVNAAEGQRAAVLASLGYTIASRWLFEHELADGSIVPALTDWALPDISLWIIFPAGRRISKRARAFADFLRACCV
jgi:DNA-binding transcriptional LysR family regulator